LGHAASDGNTTAVRSDGDLLAAGSEVPRRTFAFTAEVGAYFLASGASSDPMPESFELGAEYPISFRFETEVHVDDLLMLTSDDGRIFFQKKTYLGACDYAGFDSLDIFWLRDESLEDSANLLAPDVVRRRDRGGPSGCIR
jgi:hypothetical protein